MFALKTYLFVEIYCQIFCAMDKMILYLRSKTNENEKSNGIYLV